MADLQGDLAKLLRRPWFWLRDRQLPFILVTGGGAADMVDDLSAPFADVLPSALVRESEHDSVRSLVAALAGPQGQLGRPVAGSFLPAPRFPLAQFVLWACEQRDLPEHEGRPWPPDPQSHEGLQVFKQRLQDRNRRSSGQGERLRLAVDFFIGRAAVTWVPLGTLAVWLAAGPSDLVGVLPWLVGFAVTVLGVFFQGWASIRGWFFYGWFRRQPVMPRRVWERPAAYALRLAGASDSDIERLLVLALCRDLRQAYQKWAIPWPSWGRGLYCLLAMRVGAADGVNARFLRLLEELCEETGLPVPMVVLAAVPGELADGRSTVPLAELGRLKGGVRAWRRAQRRRRPPLRLLIRAGAYDVPLHQTDGLRRWRSQARALGYWSVVLLGLPGLVAWFAATNLADRAAHCGGLAYAERVGDECVGVLNASDPVPDDLFDGPIHDLMAKIDTNNAYAVRSGRYVDIVLFSEYSITMHSHEDTRLDAVISELIAAESYQRSVSSNPRVRILIANAGDDFRQGKRAAELVTELTDDDPHIMGVAGLSRSLSGGKAAVRQFDTAKIPTVATTATADDYGMVGGVPSPYYFHVSPTNFRQATLAARFASDTLLAGVEKASAAIVQDGTSDDDYTNNLGADFAEALKARHIAVGRPIPYGASQEGITSAADEACSRNADVIMYAGRSFEFMSFLSALEGNPKCAGGVKVLAGDDVTKIVADHAAEIAAKGRLEVYYAALASRQVWQGVALQPTGFVSRLLRGGHPEATDDNLLLTYDALDVLYRAADKAYRPGDRLPSRGDVLYRLFRTTGGSAWAGSSGVIDFGVKERHDPVNKAISIMKVTPPEASPALMVRCGSLAAGEPRSTDPRCAGLPDAPPAAP